LCRKTTSKIAQFQKTHLHLGIIHVREKNTWKKNQANKNNKKHRNMSKHKFCSFLIIKGFHFSRIQELMDLFREHGGFLGSRRLMLRDTPGRLLVQGAKGTVQSRFLVVTAMRKT